MRKRFYLLLFVLALFLFSACAKNSPETMTPEEQAFSNCGLKDSHADQLNCRYALADQHERKIQKKIEYLNSVLTLEEKKLLKKSQSAWEEYVANTCPLMRYVSGPGTISLDFSAGCFHDATLEREKDLDETIMLYEEFKSNRQKN